VHKIPGQKCRISLCEIAVKTNATAIFFFIAIGWARTIGADPPGVGLWRYRIANVTEGIEGAHSAMLHAVFIAGDDDTADLAVEDILALFVGFSGMGVEPLDDLAAFG